MEELQQPWLYICRSRRKNGERQPKASHYQWVLPIAIDDRLFAGMIQFATNYTCIDVTYLELSLRANWAIYIQWSVLWGRTASDNLRRHMINEHLLLFAGMIQFATNYVTYLQLLLRANWVICPVIHPRQKNSERQHKVSHDQVSMLAGLIQFATNCVVTYLQLSLRSIPEADWRTGSENLEARM